MVTCSNLILAGRRGPCASGTCVEPAGSGHSYPHHTLPQHPDISVATKDRSLSVHHKGGCEAALGAYFGVFPWDDGSVFILFCIYLLRQHLNSVGLTRLA